MMSSICSGGAADWYDTAKDADDFSSGTEGNSTNRKRNKILVEKRRRERINRCLDTMKTLVLQAMNKDAAEYSKMEKADILEMTVKYLQDVQNYHMKKSGMNLHAKYQAGFTECAAEVSRYLTSAPYLSADVKLRLMDHLAGCIQPRNPPPAPLLNNSLTLNHPVLNPRDSTPTNVRHNPYHSFMIPVIPINLPSATAAATLPGNAAQHARLYKSLSYPGGYDKQTTSSSSHAGERCTISSDSTAMRCSSPVFLARSVSSAESAADGACMAAREVTSSPISVASVSPGSVASLSPSSVASMSPGSVASVSPGSVASMSPGSVASVSPGSTSLAVGPPHPTTHSSSALYSVNVKAKLEASDKDDSENHAFKMYVPDDRNACPGEEHAEPDVDTDDPMWRPW